jgi:hypothetical protein
MKTIVKQSAPTIDTKAALVAIFLLAIFLAACGATSPAAPTVTDVPQVVAAVTPTNTRWPTLKPAGTPTYSTPLPTRTPKSLSTKKIPSKTPTYPPLTEVFQKKETNVEEFNEHIASFQQEWYSCGDENPWIVDFSPDGNWLATYCEHKGGNISLINTQGKIWRITDKELFGVVNKTVYRPERWSKDGKSLYFSTSGPYLPYNYEVPLKTPTSPPGTPTQPSWCFNPDIVTLINANFENKTVKFLLGNQSSYKNEWPDRFYTFAFSPEENYLAYALQDRQQSKISIKNLEDNTESTLVIQNNAGSDVVVTDLVWFPDETKILAELTICKGLKRQITTVDLQNGQQVVIPVSIPENFYIRAWNRPDIIVLESLGGSYYYLDIKTNKIVGPIS